MGRRVPAAKGLDAEGILEAAADGQDRSARASSAADPVADFPDADLARARRSPASKHDDRGRRVPHRTSTRADVVPALHALGREDRARVTNLEGRVQRVGRKVAPEGTAMDDWRIAGELALRLGADFDLATVDEVTDEIARVAPAFAGVDAALLRRARDGVVLPLAEHRDEIVLRTRDLTILADDGSGASWDPIKVEGEAVADVEADETETETAPDDVAVPDAEVVAEAARVAPDALGMGRRGSGRRGSARATRTLCASWWVGGSTTTDAWSAKPPRSRASREPFPLRISPHDAAALGVESGAEVRVTSAPRLASVTVAIDAGVPAGIAQLDFSADGTGAAELIDARRRRHRPAGGDAAMISALLAPARPAVRRAACRGRCSRSCSSRSCSRSCSCSCR